MVRRSVLISPGDQENKLEGALESAADVVFFDLEDGVAPPDKAMARETVVQVLSSVDPDESREVLLRINPPSVGNEADIEAIASLDSTHQPDGIVLPKIDGPDDVTAQRDRLQAAGVDRALWCLIESPAGVLSAESIAQIEDVTAVIFGGEDYVTAIGGERTETGTELLFARQRTVAAAKANSVDAIDGITTALTDSERVRADATEAATFGFDGKLAIHPAQIEPINEAFSPTESQIEWARKVVRTDEETGAGVFSVDDEMVDAPLIKRARQILETAKSIDTT